LIIIRNNIILSAMSEEQSPSHYLNIWRESRFTVVMQPSDDIGRLYPAKPLAYEVLGVERDIAGNLPENSADRAPEDGRPADRRDGLTAVRCAPNSP
jgi:hypothetical protein